MDLMWDFILEMTSKGVMVIFDHTEESLVVRLQWQQQGKCCAVADATPIDVLDTVPMDTRIGYWRQLYQERVQGQKGCNP